MRSSSRSCAVAIAATFVLCGAQAFAQPQVTLPQPSPQATVTQAAGLTDITVVYHRPAVRGRTIWGGLVPYGEVWRAGANENTTIEFSTPVTVGGKQLAAGIYGLHVLPTEKEWTFILSNVSWAWGSFTYDPAEDAARVTVTPVAAAFTEHLEYTIAMPDRDEAALTLRWDKLQASMPIRIDTHAVVLASLRREFRGPQQYNWQSWNSAARYCLINKIELDQGLEWADRSISVNENLQNLITKASLLELKGDAAKAGKLRTQALAIGNEADVNAYGYQLLGAGKVDEAIAVFQKNVKDHPSSWNTYDSLAEGYATKGEKKLAIEYYTKARSMAPAAHHKRIDGELAKLTPKASS